ncbi:uncharacterized protein LOC132719382 [Ruditapes philippinarum]|uniref:uncharacterized protein LOC132719382 n=1 Tax=Ruditapes philippinarum TaxID=129788 RepID=UPI00295BC274|nr:uncharacterized protein LOC132719382 [Ruditapes philippinarum]
MDDGPYDADMADLSIWNDAAQYENTNKVSGKKSECDTQKDEESHYETLHLEELDKPKSKTEIQDKSLKRLKCVIYILIVLIIVLYVTLISMIMIMFLPKDSIDGQWADWSSWTSCDVTCGNGTYLRTRACLNPEHKNNGSDCVGESLQSSDCLKESSIL